MSIIAPISAGRHLQEIQGIIRLLRSRPLIIWGRVGSWFQQTIIFWESLWSKFANFKLHVFFSDALNIFFYSDHAPKIINGLHPNFTNLHSFKRYYALCILILLAHNVYSIEHAWRIHQSVYITQTLGHMRIHYTTTLDIRHGGCVTCASRIHCIYFIEHIRSSRKNPDFRQTFSR